MDTKHLKRRGQSWYVQIAVPVRLQATLGKKTITQALNTRDLAEATKRKHQVIADVMTLFARHEGTAVGWESPKTILSDARRVHRDIASGELSKEDARRQWSIGVYEYDDHHELTPAQTNAIDDSFRIIDGESLLTISEALVHHLDELKPRVLVRTYKTRQVRINNLIAGIGDVQLVSVTKLQARQYVNKSLAGTDKTKSNHLADLTAFWGWCEQTGLVERSPFAGLKIQSSKRGKKEEQPRRAWQDAELKTLLSQMKTHLDADNTTLALTQMGMYTGMRLEEICNLKKVDIHQEYFDITEGKNRNAVRQVPIHSKLIPVVKALLRDSSDEYLIHGLKRSGDDNKRSAAMTKRFGRFTRKYVSDDRGLVFHSLRMSFTGKLEGAAVPETTADLLTGHARAGMSYGRYSKSLPLAQLKKAVNQVEYKL